MWRTKEGKDELLIHAKCGAELCQAHSVQECGPAGFLCVESDVVYGSDARRTQEKAAIELVQLKLLLPV